jgi:hypothetical protein
MALLSRAVPISWRYVAAALLLFAAEPLAAQTVRATASDVQAVFLFNFAQFVEWPAEAFSDAKAPLVIGILGEDPFGSVLDETVRGETVRGRPFKIRRYRRVDDIKDCHILFISQSGGNRLADVLAMTPILKGGSSGSSSIRTRSGSALIWMPPRPTG